MTERVAELLAPRAVYACLLEFGTYSVVRTLACLHRENRAYHHGAATSTARRQAREALRDAFCPPDETWRRQVLAHGARLLDQAARACFTSSLDAGAP